MALQRGLWFGNQVAAGSTPNSVLAQYVTCTLDSRSVAFIEFWTHCNLRSAATRCNCIKFIGRVLDVLK
uniref:Uncharacterized protein n=1 Tax=Physcomitrium patens TaxID=3218 RepID=A0A2K1LB97_PHYPA|nr:hypothetical protein PHYPA_001729 [Physcomitrium patens]